MTGSSPTTGVLKQLVGRLKLVGQQAQCYFTTAAAAGSSMVFPNGRSLEVSEQDVSFRMPGEFEPHASCWVAWPKRPDVWRADRQPAKKAFKEVITAISQFEPVTVIAHKEQWQEARDELPEDVRVVEVTIDDSWVRDSGPTFVYAELGSCPRPTIRALVGMDWIFNGWGGLYGTWDNDKLVARKICEIERAPYVSVDTVLEGGSIHVDGEGTLLTTEECLLNPNRNPTLSKTEIEDRLKQHLGVTKVIWLPKGLYGDEDTNGHVDNFACFARPGTVLLAWTDDESDPQHAISQEALALLSNETDAKGRQLEVIKLPNPRPLFRTQEEWETLAGGGLGERHMGERLAASYVNFYIANGGIVMPAFGIPEDDQRAQQVLQGVFPERKVVAVQTREVVLGGGNIHCITQQQPVPPQQPGAA